MTDILEDFACQLRDALLVAMDAADALPARLSLYPSPVVPMDICCSSEDGDGQAWVAFIGTKAKAPNRNLPCGGEVEARFAVGIARCAHTVDDRGRAPSGQELDDDALKLFRDYRIMRHAIQGIWAPEMAASKYQLKKDDWRLGDYNVHVVRGGCMASSHEVFVDFSCLPYDLEN